MSTSETDTATAERRARRRLERMERQMARSDRRRAIDAGGSTAAWRQAAARGVGGESTDPGVAAPSQTPAPAPPEPDDTASDTETGAAPPSQVPEPAPADVQSPDGQLQAAARQQRRELAQQGGQLRSSVREQRRDLARQDSFVEGAQQRSTRPALRGPRGRAPSDDSGRLSPEADQEIADDLRDASLFGSRISEPLADASESIRRTVDVGATFIGGLGDAAATPLQAGIDLATEGSGAAADEVANPTGGVYRSAIAGGSEELLGDPDSAPSSLALRVGDPDTVSTAGAAFVEEGEAAAQARESRAASFTEGVARGAGSIADLPGIVLGGSRAAGIGLELAEEGVDEPVETAETAAVLGGSAAEAAGEQLQESFTERPFQTTGAVAGAIGGGFAAGRAIGAGARGARQRLRTAGADVGDVEDLAQRSVLEGEEQFPGAIDEGLYREDPAQAVREQAREMTPDEVETAYTDAGVDSGVVLKKALPVETIGPRRSRSAQGLSGAPDETGIDAEDITEEMAVSAKESPGEFAYENPGAFLSTDISPYFLGSPGETARMSLRPGLPDIGDQPTITLVRTEVESAEADTQLGFAREMARREGETTARTKPAGSEELNPGEIEAVAPPGSEFVDIGTGVVRDISRRLGIGADYATEIDGERVPVRMAAPEGELDGGALPRPGQLFDDERGEFGAGTGGARVRRSIRRRDPDEPVDRPAPVTSGGGAGSPASAGAPSYGGSPALFGKRGAGGSSSDGVSAPSYGGSPAGPSELPGGSGASGSGGSDGGSSGRAGSSRTGFSELFGGPTYTTPGGSDGDSGGSELIPRTPPTPGGSSSSSSGGSGGGGAGGSGGFYGGFYSSTTRNRPRTPDIELDRDDEEFDEGLLGAGIRFGFRFPSPVDLPDGNGGRNTLPDSFETDSPDIPTKDDRVIGPGI